MVLAWQVESSLRCPDCNIYYEEFDPQRGGHIHAYFPRAQTCMGCKVKQDKYDAVTENSKKSPGATNGLQMILVKNDEAPNIRSPLTKKPILPR